MVRIPNKQLIITEDLDFDGWKGDEMWGARLIDRTNQPTQHELYVTNDEPKYDTSSEVRIVNIGKVYPGTAPGSVASPRHGDIAITGSQTFIYDGDGDAWEELTVTAGGGISADAVSYNNTTSGLTATDVQAAIDEIAAGGATDLKDVKITAGDTTSRFLFDAVETITGKLVKTVVDTGGGDEVLRLNIGVDVFDKTNDDATDVAYNGVLSPGVTNVESAIDSLVGGAPPTIYTESSPEVSIGTVGTDEVWTITHGLGKRVFIWTSVALGGYDTEVKPAWRYNNINPDNVVEVIFGNSQIGNGVKIYRF
jgi:hypothetical protein